MRRQVYMLGNKNPLEGMNEMKAAPLMKLKSESTGYNFYAEQVAKVMAHSGLIFDDQLNEVEEYIRGYA